MVRESFRFFRTALSDFSHAGSIFPSSPFATRTIVKHLPLHAKLVVEYGPGEGTVTRALLKRMPLDGKLLGVEVNPSFAGRLREFGDQRLSVVEDDVVGVTSRLAEEMTGQVDAIVSGIPFSFIGAVKKRKLIENTKRLLKPGGQFIVYQNSPKIGEALSHYFPVVKFRFEPRNIFPYFIYVASFGYSD